MWGIRQLLEPKKQTVPTRAAKDNATMLFFRGDRGRRLQALRAAFGLVPPVVAAETIVPAGMEQHAPDGVVFFQTFETDAVASGLDKEYWTSSRLKKQFEVSHQGTD